MSEDEKDNLIGKTAREQREAERAAACYRAQAQRTAEQLHRTANTIIRRVDGSLTKLWEPTGAEPSDEICYPPSADALETVKRYEERSEMAKQRAEQLERMI